MQGAGTCVYIKCHSPALEINYQQLLAQNKTMKLYRCSIGILRWGKIAVKSAIEVVLWLLRYQRSFALSHQVCSKIGVCRKIMWR